MSGTRCTLCPHDDAIARTRLVPRSVGPRTANLLEWHSLERTPAAHGTSKPRAAAWVGPVQRQQKDLCRDWCRRPRRHRTLHVDAVRELDDRNRPGLDWCRRCRWRNGTWVLPACRAHRTWLRCLAVVGLCRERFLHRESAVSDPRRDLAHVQPVGLFSPPTIPGGVGFTAGRRRYPPNRRLAESLSNFCRKTSISRPGLTRRRTRCSDDTRHMITDHPGRKGGG